MQPTDPSEWRPPLGDQPPIGPELPEPPERRSRRVWWLGGGVAAALVLAVVLWVVLASGGIRYELDPALQDDLLTEADYPDGYTVTATTQSELDEAEGPEALDSDDVTPGECGQMLSLTPPELDATVPTAMATAQAMSGATVYANAVFRLPDDVPDDEWNLDAYSAVMDECASIDVAAGGESIHLTLADLDVANLGQQAMAFTVGGSSGGVDLSMALGVVQSDDLLIMLMGVNTVDTVDESEFVDLFTAAVQRAG